MSKLEELYAKYLKDRDELVAKMFLEEDYGVVIEREKRALQGYYLAPVVKIIATQIRKSLKGQK